MKTHIKYPSIGQFSGAVKWIRSAAEFKNSTLPTMTFNGATKIHGTNAAVSWNYGCANDFWVQSREQIITVDNDNAGFAKFVDQNKVKIIDILDAIEKEYIAPNSIYTIYGEWCGKGIQSGCAVHQLEKMFVIFDIRVTTGEVDYWFDEKQINVILNKLLDSSARIFNVRMFETFKLDIDFEHPELAQNELVRLTNYVEQQCPVGKYFEIGNIPAGTIVSLVDDNIVSSLKFNKDTENAILKILKSLKRDGESEPSITLST
jgi:hypothetical protein